MGDVVIAASCSSRVAGFRRSDGTRVWILDASAEAPGVQFHGKPLVLGHRIAVPGDSVERAPLLLLEAGSGRLVWQRAFPGGLVTDLLGEGGLIVGVDATGTAHAVRVTDGTEAWELAIEAPPTTWRPQSPAAERGVVYVPGVDGTVRALRAETGELVWATDLPDVPSTALLVSQGAVFVGTADRRIHRLDAADGRLMASRSLRGTPFGFPVKAGAGVAVLTMGTAHGLSLISPDLARELWSTESAAEWSLFRPVVLDGLVLTGSDARELCARNAESGVRVWCSVLPSPPRSVAVADEGLFVGTLRGDLIKSERPVAAR